MKYLWLIFPLVLLLASCQAAIPPPQPTPQMEKGDQNSSWEAELIITGGFAGVQKGIKIFSSGETILYDEKNNRQFQEQLSEEEIDKFSKLVHEIKDVQVMSNPPACADCFQYQLHVTVDGTPFQATVNDLNLPNSRIAPLVNELVNLLAKAIP